MRMFDTWCRMVQHLAMPATNWMYHALAGALIEALTIVGIAVFMPDRMAEWNIETVAERQ